MTPPSSSEGDRGPAWWKLGWNPIFSFWFAYVITRSLGAPILVTESD